MEIGVNNSVRITFKALKLINSDIYSWSKIPVDDRRRHFNSRTIYDKINIPNISMSTIK